MQVKPKKVITIKQDVTEQVKRFNAAFDSLKDGLINREQEITALKLALLTGNNLLLDGPHGIAKSLLAEQAFARVTGAVVFQKQLMKGTQADELFGPMDSTIYRTQARWSHNIKNMLPDAHLAFIDEVYRGSDMLLPSILSILNERVFMNGTERVNCPLITAVATTNFVTEMPELDAFHDRWLLRVKVTALPSSVLRLRLLNLYSGNDSRPPARPKTIDVADLNMLREEVRRVNCSAEMLELYEEIVTNYRQKIGNNLYISDRRLCKTIDLIKAATLLAKPDSYEVTTAELLVGLYGITNVGNDVETGAYTTAFETVTAGHVAAAQENLDTTDLQRYVLKQERLFIANKKDATMLRRISSDIAQVVAGINNRNPNDRPRQPKNIEAQTAAVERLNEIMVDIDTILQ